MPYINIRVAGSLSKEQKENISEGVTEVVAREAGKPPESVLIFIDEVERDNVAKAGKLLSGS
ncbi:MAG: 4-oxalocrotonate tautomerase family protein [Desulfobacterales bacterium]|nr:4-oxalocrotonate tautomerase family protein [Deltaproteobacteria bacterium]MBT8362059.1 4-oxalocrotonate tautomerase family protein [Deltaproteobacteria bacterium]NNK94255.1 4-oxalocrotonate tautomerase family protein [Desulfobacterales bacterium]